MAVLVRVTRGTVEVELTGADIALSGRFGFSLPLQAIVQAGVVPRASLVGWRRMGKLGTSVPGVVTAGRYRSRGRLEFWCMHRAPAMLVVECAEGAPYGRVIVQVDDPERAAAQIRAAAGIPEPDQ